MLWSDF